MRRQGRTRTTSCQLVWYVAEWKWSWWTLSGIMLRGRKSGLVRVLQVMSLDGAEDLEPLQIMSLQGVDVRGRQIVRVVGKFFPAPAVDVERLKVYMLQKLHHELQSGPYVIVYFHTAVQRNDNYPGLWALRDIYETLPNQLKHRLQAVFVVHPGLRSRVILATLGRFFLSEGFYSKLVYISRVEFLTEYVRKGQVDIPEFVVEHDQELETRPLMDYGLEVDPLQNHDALLGTAYRLRLLVNKVDPRICSCNLANILNFCYGAEIVFFQQERLRAYSTLERRRCSQPH